MCIAYDNDLIFKSRIACPDPSGELACEDYHLIECQRFTNSFYKRGNHNLDNFTKAEDRIANIIIQGTFIRQLLLNKWVTREYIPVKFLELVYFKYFPIKIIEFDYS